MRHSTAEWTDACKESQRRSDERRGKEPVRFLYGALSLLALLVTCVGLILFALGVFR